jgi:hypothetical protein
VFHAPPLRRLPLRNPLKPALFCFNLPDLELLDLAGHRDREPVHEPDVLRNLEVRNLARIEAEIRLVFWSLGTSVRTGIA